MKLCLLFIISIIFSCDFVLSYYGPLKINQTPKIGNWTDACDECKIIINKIVEVAKDPAKLEELKLLLSALCETTGYREECLIFVKRLDLFIDRLLPFLQNTDKVCKDLHICKNRKLEHFHRVGVHFASQLEDIDNAKSSLLCEECQFAAHELLDLVGEPHVQQEVHDWLEENVCSHTGKYKELCSQYLDETLPEFFLELKTLLSDQKKFCEDLELCPAMTFPSLGSPYRRAKLGPKFMGMMKKEVESVEED
uniref:Saposin B-type domain-containing protein n=1 Tax=Meloidogyne incognita TaxID=6306 RepID=A0A914N713_MELIC